MFALTAFVLHPGHNTAHHPGNILVFCSVCLVLGSLGILLQLYHPSDSAEALNT